MIPIPDCWDALYSGERWPVDALRTDYYTSTVSLQSNLRLLIKKLEQRF